MTYLFAYVGVLVTLVVLDVLMLTLVVQPAFKADVPHLLAESPRIGVAAMFYAIYAVGVVYFAVSPALATGSVWAGVRDGAMLGFIGYGVYEFTNMATLNGWTWRMVQLDLAWGTVLTAVAAGVGVYAASRV